MLLRFGRRVPSGEEVARTAVSRRRSRARPDLLAGIPEEILQEILVRLPAKSVIRCRAVCRSWRSLASDPAFLLDHHRRQPELPLIRSFRTADDVHDLFPCLESLHLQLQDAEFRPVFGFPEQLGSNLPVRASCDGLFIVGQYICNPTTRECAPLSSNPKLHVSNLVALYRHQPSGEYRVLYWTQSNISAEHSVMYHTQWGLEFVEYCPSEYRVLTVGSDQPRPITCSLAPVDGEEDLISGVGPRIFGAPVLLHGSIHVHCKSPGVENSAHRYHRIMVFDTVAESFRHMRPPPVNPRHAMHLFDMGGTLAASTSKDGMTGMNIFFLQDREQDVWAFQYQIKLPAMGIRSFQEQGDWSAKVVSEDGGVLVSCFGHLLHYDSKGNLVANFKYDDDLPVVLPHRLKESLIQHVFFHKN